MKKIFLVMILSLFLVGCNFAAEQTTAEPQVIDTENFIEISSVDDLKNIEMNKSYILTQNLDLSGLEWEPLGSYNQPYLGVFDGNNYTISNLSITQKNTDINGLFTFVKGDVKNLIISNFNIAYQTNNLSFIGGLAGIIEGSVENVKVSGAIDVTSTESNVFAGLLAGTSQKQVNLYQKAEDFVPATIANVEAEGEINVTANKIAFVGGLLGKNFNTIVKDNYVETILTVTTEESSAFVGGLIGHNYQGVASGYEDNRIAKNLFVQNNLVKSEINVVATTLKAYVGGLVGYNYFGDLKDNFVLTAIEAEGDYGYWSLFVGENWNSDFTDNVVAGELTGTPTHEIEQISTAFTGRVFGISAITNSYFSSSNDFSDSEGKVNQELLLDQDWFIDTLGWELDFINRIIQLQSQ